MSNQSARGEDCRVSEPTRVIRMVEGRRAGIGAAQVLCGAVLAGCQLMLDERALPAAPGDDVASRTYTVSMMAQPQSSLYRFGDDPQRGTNGQWGSWSDCDRVIDSEERATSTGSAALRFVGLRRSKLHLGSEYPPRGEMVLNLFRAGQSTLVLSAEESVHWTVHLGAGASIEAVYVSGPATQTIWAPGALVYEQNGSEVLSDWPTADGDGLSLVIGLEAALDQEASSIHACPEMSLLTLFEEPSPGATCSGEAPLVGATCAGNVLARGSLQSASDSAQFACERRLIRGASCCAVQRDVGEWVLTDGAVTAGDPADELRSASLCTP